MTPSDSIFAVIWCLMITSAILYVLFGQITVRKLRKNPDTKHELGIEFASGWDILNVAQALSLPKFVTRRFQKSRLHFLQANSEILYKHTSSFDRLLARAFYWLWMISALSLITFALLDVTGILP